MNRKLWTTLFLAAVLLLAPYAAADDPPPEKPREKGEPEMSPEAKIIGDAHHPDPAIHTWFGPDPTYDHEPYDAEAQLAIYGGKHMNPQAKPPVELGIRLYDYGAYTPRPTWLGERNPINFALMAYGDLRVAGAYYDNGGSDQSVLAARLNMDIDMAITATERVHAFIRPLDKNGSFTRYQISGPGDNEFVDQLDFNLDTLFFEGDANAIREGFTGKPTGYDLPIAFGRVPIFTQNGVWIDDAIDGAAFSITARSSAKHDISNMDFTFFGGFNQVTTDADPSGDAKVLGMAGFADLRKGYAEWGYGYVMADDNDLSYHNLTAAFTKRYRPTATIGMANSVRVIGNFGQSGGFKTADGVLLLVENSFYRSNPVTLVPYVNLFAGFDSPQSLARTAGGGGVLKNTGINFESDGMTNYPTLDARGHESYGGAFGVEYLFALDRQLVVEAAAVQRTGGSPFGDEYALGVRYQHRVNNAWIVRADAMHGWIQGSDDRFGVRLELRRKF